MKGWKMKKYDKIFWITMELICLMFLGLVISSGCKKQSQPITETSVVVSAAIEQKTCPVTGDPIDKNVFIEYQGKKVYFCCTDCKAIFEKNPERYISKLPQFAK
jgi:YHS domain-containing protein